jgi:hypothetical protein
MNQVAAMFAPLLLLLPGATAVDAAQGLEPLAPVPSENAGIALAASPVPETGGVEGMAWSILTDSFRAPVEQQVRIEQRMTIRISPRSAAPPPLFFDLPQQGLPPHFQERHMGRCLPISAIAAVQAGGDNRLLLFMRDHQIISAELEKACKARDFYSGFYVDRNADGQICVNRDKLQSRAGANCSLKRLRQLIEADN